MFPVLVFGLSTVLDLTRLAESQVLTTDGCFRKWENCIIVNAQPFDRRTAVTEEECRNRCLSVLAGQYVCRSFVYDKHNYVCDLFAHTGNSYPAKLIQYYGRDYYEPTGTCAGPVSTVSPPTATPPITTTTPTLPSSVTCPADQTARLLRVEGMALVIPAGNGVTLPLSESQCVQTCLDNRSPTGQTVSCLSYNYDRNAGQCTFVTTAAGPRNGQTGQLRPAANTNYYEKICIPSNQGVQNCDQVFDRFPQMILVGFAETVEDARTEEECVQLCVNSVQLFGFPCLAGMFYFNEPQFNCILTRESKDTQPGLFTAENQDSVDYFEPNCQPTGGGRFNDIRRFSPLDNEISDSSRFRRPTNAAASALRRLQPRFGEWTAWSPCDRGKDGRRVRYKVCGESDLTDCPFETEWCNSDDNSPTHTVVGSSSNRITRLNPQSVQKSIDISFRDDSRGSFNRTCEIGECCPHRGSCRIGVATLASGEQQWCTNPCTGK